MQLWIAGARAYSNKINYSCDRETQKAVLMIVFALCVVKKAGYKTKAKFLIVEGLALAFPQVKLQRKSYCIRKIA